MPRFFFQIHDGLDILDSEGVELSDWEDAQAEAVRLAGSVIAENAKTAKLGEDWLMEVTDDKGLVLLRLDFHLSGSAAIWKSD